LGIEKSEGELILFIDSDCEADPLWMETIYKKYIQEGFDACGGPDAAKSDFSPFQKAIDYSMTSFFTTGGMRGHSRKMMAKFYPRSHNMGMTRKLVNKVGGFGNLRHGQDIELSHRILQSGANVSFIPEAVVYHRRRTSLRSFFKQTFNWGVARINLFKIDIALLEPIHFLPSIGLITIITVIIGCILSVPLFRILCIIGLIFFFIQCIFGSVKQRDIRVFGHLIFIIPTQIIGYGTGFLTGFTKRIILKSEPFTGFEKKYYSD
jgi:GT2 family glycosyltransferase